MSCRQTRFPVKKQNSAAFFDRCDPEEQSKGGHDPEKKYLIHFVEFPT